MKKHKLEMKSDHPQQYFSINTKPDDEIDLHEYIGILINAKWLILGCIIVFMAVASLYVFLKSPVYQANALLQIEEKQGSLGDITNISLLMTSNVPTETEVEIIRSRSVLGKVVNHLRLDERVHPHWFPLIGPLIYRRYKEEDLSSPLFGMNSFAWGGEKIVIDSMDVDEQWLEEPFTLVTDKGGKYHLIDSKNNILLKGAVGEPAIVNGLSIFVSVLKAGMGTRFDLYKDHWQEAVATLKENLSIKEKGKQTGILNISYQSNNPQQAMLVVNKVAQIYLKQNVERKSEEVKRALIFLQQQLPEIKARMIAAESELNNYRQSRGSINLGMETQSILSQMVEIEGKISEIKLKRAELDQKFKEQHPLMLTLDKQSATLMIEKRALEKEVEGLPDAEQKILTLARNVEVNSALYTSLLDKSQELKVVKAGAVGNIRILDPAVFPSKPENPKTIIVIILGLGTGFFLGVFLSLIRNALRNGLKDPEVIERQLGVAVYASIPHSDDQDKLFRQMSSRKNTTGEYLLASVNHEDLAIESLRSMRTHLHFSFAGSAGNIIAMSGPTESVGKTFVSANLAYIMAATQRVLIIDGDMRRGHLHKYFGLQRSSGLSCLLSDKAALDKVIYPTENKQLFFMPCGTYPPNPSELLMSDRFSDLLQELSSVYDLILIDTPPVLAVTDAVLIGRRASFLFLLLRFGRHPLREVKQTIGRLNQGGVKVEGILINDVMPTTASYGYHYPYSYKSEKQ